MHPHFCGDVFNKFLDISKRAIQSCLHLLTIGLLSYFPRIKIPLPTQTVGIPVGFLCYIHST